MSDDDQSRSSIELRSLRRSSTIESGRQLEAISDKSRRRGVLQEYHSFSGEYLIHIALADKHNTEGSSTSKSYNQQIEVHDALGGQQESRK